MGYERNDRRFGGEYRGDFDRDNNRDRGFGAGRYPGATADRGERERGAYPDYRGNRFDDRGDYAARDGGRDPRGYDPDDRGFFDRAGDEVRSWFGDEDAERRRRADERRQASGDYGSRDAGRSSYPGVDAYGFGATSGLRGGSGNDRSGSSREPGYHSWRDRQIQQFDQDYDDYRREHQKKFDDEFHSWRQGRQGQRDLLGKVREHQEVVGSDGQHIGTVDHVRGDRIKLTKTDQDAGGHHHTIPSSWLQSVEDTITVSKTADQAKAHWRDEDRNRGDMFGGRNDDRGANLGRSFSGTY